MIEFAPTVLGQSQQVKGHPLCSTLLSRHQDPKEGIMVGKQTLESCTPWLAVLGGTQAPPVGVGSTVLAALHGQLIPWHGARLSPAVRGAGEALPVSDC